MTLQDLAIRLRALTAKYPTIDCLIEYDAGSNRVNLAGCAAVGELFIRAYRAGAFNDQYFADLRPALIAPTSVGDGDETAVASIVMGWLRNRGHPVDGTDASASPFNRLARVFEGILSSHGGVTKSWSWQGTHDAAERLRALRVEPLDAEGVRQVATALYRHAEQDAATAFLPLIADPATATEAEWSLAEAAALRMVTAANVRHQQNISDMFARMRERRPAVIEKLRRQNQPAHSADFTAVKWFGMEYNFAIGVQSAAVRLLWEEWERTGLGLHQETIREKIDPERDRGSFRMDAAFRNHPALGTMIQPCGKGRYRLARPGEPPVTTAPPGKKSRKSRRNHG